MISARSRDARKELELDLGVVGEKREMDEAELEEGEAFSYQNHENYNSSIDPDALSYIDEKLQVVLGHFQKDFEGGVSAENLGAKFGGYGSFLPSYQRSPVWSHPRTPQEVHSQNASRSPNNLQSEGRRVDPVHSSAATQPLRIGPTSAGLSRLPAVKALFTDDGINQEKYTTNCVEAVPSNYESLNTKSTNFLDQKTLKVRIKMGTDCFSTRKNAEIHSLGLNGSQSSSLDDSPLVSEGIFHEPPDTQYESPISILQIMTSFPVLLSPLPNDLLQLPEKEACARDSISVPMHMDDLESYGMLQPESNIGKNDREALGGKKMKPGEEFGSSIEVKGSRSKSARNHISVPSRKERGIDELASEELISNTLKLPLLSDSHSFGDGSIRGVDGLCDVLKEANKTMVRAKAFPDQAQEKRVEPSATEVNGFVEKSKAGAGRKVLGDKGGNSVDDLSIHAVKDDPHRDKMCDSMIAEPAKKAYQGGSFYEKDCSTLPVVKEHSLPGGKKKSVGSYGTVATKREKEVLRVATSVGPKMKSSNGDSSTCKRETEDFPIQKNHEEAKDTYREFFGESEEEEDRTDSLGCPYVDRLKDSEAVERSTSESNYEVKDRSGGKIVDRSSTLELYPKTAANLVQCTGNDADNVRLVPTTTHPFVIEENWVQCDRCQKWRLLPVGTDPDHLPEKWLCSMLNWLPGMNRCSFSEDETTKALIALYHGTAPDSHGNLQVQSVSRNIMQGGALSTVQQQLNHSLHAMPPGKKKFVKELSHSAIKDGSSQFSSSIKKNLQPSVKNKSLNDMNKSPAVSEPDVSGNKHKNKQKIPELNSDSGDTANVKAKSRKDSLQDCSRPSKKAKTEGMHSTDEECTARKVGHSSNGSLPSNSAGKGELKVTDHSSSRDSKYETKDRTQASGEKSKRKGKGSLDEQSQDPGNYDNTNHVKKRRLKEYHDTETCSTDYDLQENRVFVKEQFSDCRKEKEARMPKSEVRDSSNSKGSVRTKKQKARQDLRSTLSQQSLDGMDSLKRDLGSVQEPAAATSSSSKVSGSHKTKVNFQELKGSPVESVSSSPMRNLNTDKVTNREFSAKHDSHNISAIHGSRRFSDAEDDDRSDGPRIARKDKSSTIAHYRSSMLDFQEKDVKLVSDIKSEAQTHLSPDVTASRFRNGGLETVVHNRTHPSIEQIKDQCLGEGRPDAYCADVSYPRKIERGFPSRFKDSSQGSKSEFDAEKIKNVSSLGQLQDPSSPSEAKQRDDKVKLPEKPGFKSHKSEDIIAGSKGYAGTLSNGSRKKENDFNNGGHDLQEVSVNAMCKPEALSAPRQNHLLGCDAERSSKRSISKRIDQELLGKGKPLSLPPSRGAQNEILGHFPQPGAGFHRENGDMAVDLSKVDDASKLQKKQIRKGDHQSGTQHLSARHPTLNGRRTKELDGPSPIRKDSSSHAFNNALREAKDLKHLADRLKNSGSFLESTGMYFEAALKFLHAASLLESSNNAGNTKMYSSTAKLCEFCAHEYEKSKDMAAAALAYKCTEVAYMRVIYSSHNSASRDRQELQKAPQMLPLGESPSSSASDVDNVNNSTTADKAALSKGVTSPQISGSHVIAAQNRPNFVRLLKFAQDVNCAMEASRKSQIAFQAANASLVEAKYAEGISSIKKALDFNFQDVAGLLRLVRLAKEAINC